MNTASQYDRYAEMPAQVPTLTLFNSKSGREFLARMEARAKEAVKETAKKAGKAIKYGAAVILTALALNQEAKAQDYDSGYTKSITEITRESFERNPVTFELADARSAEKPKSGLTAKISSDEAGNIECGVYYSASTWKEVGNGMLMLVTPYRKNKATGKTEILPAYTRPFRAGGILSPEWGLIASTINGAGYLFGRDDKLVYNPFSDNAKLTSGMLLDQIVIGAVAAGSGGGGSKDSGSTSATTTTSSTTSTSSTSSTSGSTSSTSSTSSTTSTSSTSGDTSSGDTSSGSSTSDSSSGSTSSGSFGD